MLGSFGAVRGVVGRIRRWRHRSRHLNALNTPMWARSLAAMDISSDG
jgi:hypothetical protein